MAIQVLAVLGIFFGLLTLRAYRFARRHRLLRDWRMVLVGNSLLLITLISAVAFGLEIYFAHVYEGTDNFGAADSTIAWMKKYYRDNNWGFRDNIDYPSQASPNKRNIVFLGDSSTEGAGIENVDERFGNIVRLRNKDQWDVRVLARGGNSTGAELLDLLTAYRNHAYRADLVVVVYDINDILDLSPEYGAWERKGYDRAMELMNQPWVKCSSLATYVMARWAASASFNMQEYSQLVEQAYSGIAWEKETLRLRLLRDLAVSQGGQFAIVMLAYYKPEDAHRRGRNTATLQERLEWWCQSNGSKFLTLQTVFNENPGVDFAVSATDDHPNELAHRLFADRIEPFLRDSIATSPNRPPSPSIPLERIASLAESDWLDSPAIFAKLRDYFEKNGEPEWASQMRWRSQQTNNATGGAHP
jgi:lysophospholipase L1-like esterase